MIAILLLFELLTFTVSCFGLVIYYGIRYGWRAALKVLPSAALVGLLCVFSSLYFFNNSKVVLMTCVVAVFWSSVFISLPKFWEWLFKKKPKHEAVLSFAFLLVATMAFGCLFVYFHLRNKSPWL